MKKSATLLAALAVAFAADGTTVRTATEDFVTNRIAAAVAAIPSPDFMTNNAAFVEAVRSTPLTGADPSDLAEIVEYGSYGTVGAAILALIAGLAALKRRMASAETSLAGKQDALSPAQLANIAAVSGKADAADLRYRIAEAEYSASVGTAGGYVLADRTENYITIPVASMPSIDIELPDVIGEPYADRPARDFFLDIDNSANASDLALEFTGLGTDYAFVTDKDDSVGDMMTIADESAQGEGDGEKARLYFNECGLSNGGMPVFHVARVTLGDFVTSTTSQGGN